MFNVQCPYCRGIFSVEQNATGMTVACPLCKETVFIAPSSQQSSSYGDSFSSYYRKRSQPLQEHHGTPVLVIGVISILVFPPFGFIAFFLGLYDLKKMKAGFMDRSGRSSVVAGVICGALGIVMTIAYVVIIIFVLQSGEDVSWHINF